MTLVLGTFVTVRGEYLHLHGLLGIKIGLQMCPTIFVYVLVFLFFNTLQEVPTIQYSSFGSKISDSGSVVVVCESIYDQLNSFVLLPELI